MGQQINKTKVFCIPPFQNWNYWGVLEMPLPSVRVSWRIICVGFQTDAPQSEPILASCLHTILRDFTWAPKLTLIWHSLVLALHSSSALWQSPLGNNIFMHWLPPKENCSISSEESGRRRRIGLACCQGTTRSAQRLQKPKWAMHI